MIIVEIISTNRETNSAYVAFGNTEDKMTNWDFPLDVLEEYAGCKFSDGDHPFVKFTIYEQYVVDRLWKN